ncbi:MAG: DUF3131 domain-containing protein [Oscillospiraceae bacterium]|nr:DUF3131 domain-containing protein [Oscillospiraceae bacterium]
MINISHFENTGLAEKLSASISGKTCEFRSAQNLRHRLKYHLRRIRSAYKHTTLRGGLSAAGEWLCDNYYMIEKDGKSLLKDLKTVILPQCEKSSLPQIYLFTREAVFDYEFEFSTETSLQLISLFESHRPMQNFELDFFKNAVRIGAIEGVYKSVTEKMLPEQSAALISKCIKILANIDLINLDVINENKNQLDILLQQDDIYPAMNETTRHIYRYKLSKIALKTNTDEMELAHSYIGKSKAYEGDGKKSHVGYYIYEDYDRLVKKHTGKKLHLPMLIGFSILISVGVSLLMGNPLWTVPVFFAVWEMIRPIIEHICLSGSESEYAPRLEFDGTIPETAPTLAVLSTMLPAAKELDNLGAKLEKLYYTNGNGSISFLVLADLKEAKLPVLPEDNSQIRACAALINRLNVKYKNKFMLLVRRRSYSATGNAYTGKERKRGAITDLVSLIKGKDIRYAEFCGDIKTLKDTKYILALDYDTRALLESASSLAAVAEHPLNRPIIDKDRGVVTSGYGIIAPKMVTQLKSSLKTPFTKIMCGAGGVSAYDFKCADIYQDLYDDGIFSGKGLICVDTFYQLLSGLFPSETVLSHDILEGGFLRTRFAGDIELSDGFPANATPYFKRLHRWIRGDFQNVAYIGGSIETASGRKKNPLSAINRFKIFDNIRRELTPVLSLILLFAAYFLPHGISAVLTLVVLLGLISPYLFGLAGALFHGGLFALSRKYYSNVMPHTFELIYQMAYNLILLPQFAYTAADGAIRGLYRRFVSKKRMLEWTTAAQIENKKDSLAGIFNYYWFGELAGVFFLTSGYGFMRVFGLLFIFTVPLVWISGREYRQQIEQIPDKTRDTLTSNAAAMWNFYCDYAGASENWLPPDNVQEAPVFKIAHRTSPTNIGLLLLSVLSAADFDFIDAETMQDRISKTIGTIERMDKWKGNLYNWYDTKTLQTLEPAYVSAVDSGNLLCCLVALKEGLKEYASELPAIQDTISRIEILIDNTDLTVFYDKNKKLFAIGYDFATESFSGSYYDMLMSEARMLSYFAVAKRQVPKKHWSALSRTLTLSGSFTGPISWTGTMFEYFMPELLLHNTEGSLGYEGLRFCLYCQKKRARAYAAPFGISESGYYAFDTELNYQYKANGVQKIALKRGMNNDHVVSPYSSYLTLSHAPHTSYRNLELLKSMGVFGKYGHYEAVDFTKERIGSNEYAIIKSYMAHHVGMSIVAVNNALHGGIMQKRFLSDRYMNSASELLQEKISNGAIIYEGVYKKEGAKKNIRETAEELEYDKIYPHLPRVKLLSNGEITSVITDNGCDYLIYRNQDVTRRTKDILRRPLGIFAAVSTGSDIIPFTQAPQYHDKYKRNVTFSSNSVMWTTNCKDMQLAMQKLVHPTFPCQQVSLAVKNTGSKRQKAEVFIYLEPVLCDYKDDAAHPAFSKLFVHVEYDKTANVITAKRKRRKNEKLIYMAVGFTEDIEFEFESRRENILSRPSYTDRLFSGFGGSFKGEGGVPDSCIAIKFPAELGPRSRKDYVMIVSAAASLEEAVENILKIRRQGGVSKEKAAKCPLVHDTIEGRLASVLLPQILFGKKDGGKNLEAVSKNYANIKLLWTLGISGDLPIVALEIKSEADADRVKNYIICQNKLRFTGVMFDLVLLFREGGDYGRPLTGMINTLISKEGSERRVAVRGGVFLIDMAVCGEETINLIYASAAHVASKKMITPEDVTFDYNPIKLTPVKPVYFDTDEGHRLNTGFFYKNSFYITTPPKLPWCHILANPGFGTLVSDKALGFTWAVNARENKLTPWFNDTMSDNRGELLIIKSGNRYYDLVNGSQAVFNPEFALWHGMAGNLRSTVRVTVPAKGMIKYIDAEIRNTSDKRAEIKLAYYFEPVMGVSRDTAGQISMKLSGNILCLRNPVNQSVRSYMGVSCSEGFTTVCSRPEFLCGRWDDTSIGPEYDPCGSLIVGKTIEPGEKIDLRFSMAFASSEEGVQKLLQLQPDTKYTPPSSIRLKTPDEGLNYLVNTWLPRQTVMGRLYGRTGFSQCGGAYGFRDQLQDVCNYMLIDNNAAKLQIIRACSCQFAEGDVLHWWHNLPKYGGGKKGVRTRYSDDLLWLPYTVCEYVEKTGDSDILDIEVAYLSAPELAENENEKYLEVTSGELKESVFDHCVRAIERAYRLGEHRLPLMGCGDWNDGYNMVGAGGKGESVWLAQFLAMVLKRFSLLCARTGRSQLRDDYYSKAITLLAAVDEFCWDGSHYIRAFFDDGDRMGSAANEECAIDSLTQSFSVLAEMTDQSRKETALESAYTNLVDKEHGIVKLFTPSYDNSRQNPGYVKSYPAGVRENGGQYTHAAVWMAMALLKHGDGMRGYELIKMLGPVNKYKDNKTGPNYMLEPYYMAADVYTNPDCYGRGGWSIYTGAAGWYCTAVIEYLAGIKIADGFVTVNPVIPEFWDGYSAEVDFMGSRINIIVKRGKDKGIFDGGVLVKAVPLDKNTHDVTVVI